jgi:hypothetical protein
MPWSKESGQRIETQDDEPYERMSGMIDRSSDNQT